MSKPHHQEGKTQFIMRSADETAQKGWAGAKKHSVSTVITLIVGTLTGTFIPMLEQHWQDEGVQAQIESVQTQDAKALAEFKSDQQRADDRAKDDEIRAEGALWHEIHILQGSNAMGKIISPNYLPDHFYANQ